MDDPVDESSGSWVWSWCPDCTPSSFAPLEVLYGQVFAIRGGCGLDHHTLVELDREFRMTIGSLYQLAGWPAVELAGWEWWRSQPGVTICDMVVKRKDGWHVMSSEGKHLGGPYKSKTEADHRLAQVEMFKAIDKAAKKK